VDESDEIHEIDQVLVTRIKDPDDAHDFVFRNPHVFVQQVGEGDGVYDAQAFSVVLSEDGDEVDMVFEGLLADLDQNLL
jgi:hypothetical protein